MDFNGLQESAGTISKGIIEPDLQNWEKAQECFEDNKCNLQVLQAYAIMERRETYIEAQSIITLDYIIIC
eukprot:10667012-Ditylum_brightwellii.AAC.1